MNTGRQSTLVTFKLRDQRADNTVDKLDMVRSVMTQGMQPRFFNAITLSMIAGHPPTAPHLVDYDVNQYEAPIAAAHLTGVEIDVLTNNANVTALWPVQLVRQHPPG